MGRRRIRRERTLSSTRVSLASSIWRRSTHRSAPNGEAVSAADGATASSGARGAASSAAGDEPNWISGLGVRTEDEGARLATAPAPSDVTISDGAGLRSVETVVFLAPRPERLTCERPPFITQK